MMISNLPIPICTIVNLKKGYGGRTTLATRKPINEPDMAPRTTFTGINHLQKVNADKSPACHIFYSIAIKIRR